MKLYYDVIVIGGGHAGCEAACASAGLGARTCLVTMDMNKIGQMSCNPAVGGIAKGQIVREVDALGGRMGIVTDRTAIQSRMLNRSKGPAMWSPRAQCDRGKFIWEWRHQLDNTENLDIWQDQVTEIRPTPHTPSRYGGRGSNNVSDTTANSKTHLSPSLTTGGGTGGGSSWVCRTLWGVELHAPCVVLTAGTFLNGLMHIGRTMVPGGRIAEPAALHLTESINALGIRSARMKTGTPVRIDARSVDYSLMERQDGEVPLLSPEGKVLRDTGFFSYMPAEWLMFKHQDTRDWITRGMTNDSPALTGGGLGGGSIPCWTTNTNAQCHEVLLQGLPDSPLYNGQIQSTGPRYCPSVETKLMTFPDRDSHPLFLEPEGTDTNEMYLNGFSSSMPMDIQLEALKQIPAFRNIRIYRPGYAIEYDYFDPTQLKHTLESKICEGLFFAGQVNGTTGYEEAAGQGLMAGINAALKAGAKGSDRSAENAGFILQRDEAYIGVLIDDLVMKGVDEPYRMFTSRAEYRILLRQDDADRRLTPLAYDLGLATTERQKVLNRKLISIESLTDLLRNTVRKNTELNPYLESIGSTPLHGSAHLNDLLTRPGVTINGLIDAGLLRTDNEFSQEVIDATEIIIKYDGYIRREREYAEKMHRLENIRIPRNFDYDAQQSLSTEARQKLTARRPETLAQASRIPGVSPSDINVLLVLFGR